MIYLRMSNMPVCVCADEQKGGAKAGIHALPRLQAPEDPPCEGIVVVDVGIVLLVGKLQ